MKQIYLPDHLKKEILKLKWNVNGERRRVSVPTLWAALNFTTQTGLAKTLRAAAMQRGGVVYDSSAKPTGYIPECYSSIDHKAGLWTFVFAGRITLVYRRDNDTVELSIPDEPTQAFNDVKTVPQLLELQYLVEQIANQARN